MVGIAFDRRQTWKAATRASKRERRFAMADWHRTGGESRRRTAGAGRHETASFGAAKYVVAARRQQWCNALVAASTAATSVAASDAASAAVDTCCTDWSIHASIWK